VAAHPTSTTVEASVTAAAGLTPPSSASVVEAQAPCRDDQLVAYYRGAQGATQHVVAGYWVTDISSEPCELSRRVRVDELDPHGRTLATSTIGGPDLTPIALSANTPPVTGITSTPAANHQIALISLTWPETENVQCPVPISHASQLRLTFAGGPSVLVVDNRSENSGDVDMVVCGNDGPGGIGPLPLSWDASGQQAPMRPAP